MIVALAAACGHGGERDTDGGVRRDGGVPPPPMTKAYLFDRTIGIYRLSKDATTGALAVADPTPVSAAEAGWGTTNKQGTHLYALARVAKRVLDFTIEPDGRLTPGPVLDVTPCWPTFAALHPRGDALAVACDSGYVVAVPVHPDGTLGSPQFLEAGENPISATFTADGRCLYVADLNGFNSDPEAEILMYRFASGIPELVGTFVGPRVTWSVAAHPRDDLVFAAGVYLVESYAVGPDCALTRVASAAIGPNTQQVTVAPSGDRLFVTGTEVYVFDIAAGGALSPIQGNPFLQKGMTMFGAIMDPGMPTLLYITGGAFDGIVTAVIARDGSLTEGPFLHAGMRNSEWVQLAP